MIQVRYHQLFHRYTDIDFVQQCPFILPVRRPRRPSTLPPLLVFPYHWSVPLSHHLSVLVTVGFAFPMLHCQTLHPFSPYQYLRARPRRHLTTAFKKITTVVGRRSPWIFQRVLQLKYLKLRVGNPYQWLARHQASQPSRVPCEKQLLHEMSFYPAASSCTPMIFALSIYLFYFPCKMAFFSFFLLFCSLIASISACHSERCLPVASRFITVLIGIVSIPIRILFMAYYFLARLARLIKLISCGAFCLGRYIRSRLTVV